VRLSLEHLVADALGTDRFVLRASPLGAGLRSSSRNHSHTYLGSEPSAHTKDIRFFLHIFSIYIFLPT
jgi:hypothetical protein